MCSLVHIGKENTGLLTLKRNHLTWKPTFKHGKKPLFFHKLYRHCTVFSEYVLRRYDSKQIALGEPNHALWQSLESVRI